MIIRLTALSGLTGRDIFWYITRNGRARMALPLDLLKNPYDCFERSDGYASKQSPETSDQ